LISITFLGIQVEEGWAYRSLSGVEGVVMIIPP
jgi:hypothetical protein